MLNLSKPEVIQAHKDYAKRTCSVCEVDIGHKHHTAKCCSHKCAKKAYRQSDKGKAKQRVYGKTYRQTDKGKATKEAYKKTDVYIKCSWMKNQKRSKRSERVCGIFEKGTEAQRARFANWLLKVWHRSCRYYAVDDWIAEYNTSAS